MFGPFDPSKHPRVQPGEHGGGEFAPEDGSAPAAGLAAPASSQIGLTPSMPAAPSVARGARLASQSATSGVGPAPVAAAQPDDQGGSSIGHLIMRTLAANADDYVVMAIRRIAVAHPEWFERFAKQAPGGDLAKYDAEQPRDADGKWTAVAAGGGIVAAGAAGAAAGGAAVHQVRRRALADVKAALQPVRSIRANNAARATRHAAAIDGIERGLRSSMKFLAPATRSLASQTRRADRDLRQHMGEHAEPFWPDQADQPVWASTDADGEASLRERRDSLATDLAALREKGHPPRRVEVKGWIYTPKVAEFNRTIRLPPKVVWRGVDDSVMEQGLKDIGINGYGEEIESLYDSGFRSLADLNAYVLSIPRKYLPEAMFEYGLPVPRIIRPYAEQTVRNTERVVPDHTRVIDGYPDAKGRKTLRRQIKFDLDRRRRDWLDRETQRAAERVAPAKDEAHTIARPALRTLAIFRTLDTLPMRRTLASLSRRSKLTMLDRPSKLAAIGLGALAGASAAGAVVHRLLAPRELNKSADESPPDPAQTIFDAGAEVEKPLSENIAATFGRWTALPAAMLTNPSAALHATMASSFARAAAPLDEAAAGGAAAEVPVAVQTKDGEGRIISMSLDTGSSKVKQFSDTYRVKLAGQIADEQFAVIQAVLRDATANGTPPAKTARQLRQVIGLTPTQAGYVTSYRAALETLDPNALRRALRDARYDKTVMRAIEVREPLSDDQVNAMVDAYQRRALALRAMTIARTEGVGAANNGHAIAVGDFLDENSAYTVVKTWMSTHDERTRPDHVAMNGQQVVGLYTPFVAPSGDRILWPHHPDATLRQRVNCRCTFACALVPRTGLAQSGFGLVADSPPMGMNTVQA